MTFNAQLARRAQVRFTRLFVRFPEGVTPESVTAQVVDRLRAAEEFLRAGLYEVLVHSDSKWIEVSCGWADHDSPIQEGQQASLWTVLEWLSTAFGGVAVGLASDPSGQHFHFELFEGGRRIRALLYDHASDGWARSTGRAQAWERAVFFSEEDLNRLLALVESDEQRYVIKHIFAFDEIKLGLSLPFRGLRVVVDRIARVLDLPGSGGAPRSTAVELQPSRWVRIVRPPRGEAPEAIRKAWVGLELPLAYQVSKTEPQPQTLTSRLRRFFGINPPSRFEVDAEVALVLLEHHAPEAARWWRARAVESTLRFDQQACEMRPSTDAPRAVDAAILWATHAWRLAEQGRSPDSESFGVVALAALESAGPEYEREYLKTLNNLATVYRRLGRYEDAVLALEACARRHETAGNSEPLRTVLNNLATAFSHADRGEDANRIWERCLALAPAPADVETARVLDNMVSNALSASGDPGPAFLEHALRARAIWVAASGEDSVDAAINGVVLGSLKLRSGHFDDARRWVVSSIATLSKHLGERHPELCDALNLLGAVEIAGDRLVDAEKAFRRSLDIGQAALGEAAPVTVDAAEGLRTLELLEKRLRS